MTTEPLCSITGKIVYPTREAAEASARTHKTAMIAYDWCECGQWHLAKKNRRSRRRGDPLSNYLKDL